MIATLQGCGDQEESSRGKSNASTASGGELADAGQSFDASFDNTARLRFVHLVEELGPVDFCYRSIGTTDYSGPILINEGAADAGRTDSSTDASSDSVTDAESDANPTTTPPLPGGSLLPLSASTLLSMAIPGTLEIAVLTRDYPTCNAPLFTSKITLDVGKMSWIALLGKTPDGGAGDLVLKRFVTDPRGDNANARIRVVHAANASSNSLDVALDGTGETSLARTIPRYATPAESVDPSIDSLGYRTLSPLPPPTRFSIRTSGVNILGAWNSAFTDLALNPGSIHTTFIASSAGSFAVLHCSETDDAACALVRAP